MESGSLQAALIDAELRAACQMHGADYAEVAKILRSDLKVVEHNGEPEVVVWNRDIDMPRLSLKMAGSVNMGPEERIELLKTEKPELFTGREQKPGGVRTLGTIVSETKVAGHTVTRTAGGQVFIDGEPAERLSGGRLMSLGTRPTPAKPVQTRAAATVEFGTLSGAGLMRLARSEEPPRRPAA
jgi:hypothetical protein